MKLKTTIQFRLALPIALLLLFTFLVWLTDGDLRLARAVYGQRGVWPGINRFPWDLFYEYAGAPAFLLAGLAGGVLLGGLFLKRLASQRRPALFLLLLLALGPGLVVNVLLKDHLGRARPREVQEFLAASTPLPKFGSGEKPVKTVPSPQVMPRWDFIS